MPPSIAELLATGEPLVLPGVYDALSARLAAAAGFRAIFLSGFAMAATRLGRPDIGLLTQTEVLDTARLVCAASPCPVVVDIDTGWGGPLNVERTVAELLRLGAAGCFLEDQEWPKRCGHMEGKRIVPLDEFLPKLHAALRLRETCRFMSRHAPTPGRSRGSTRPCDAPGLTRRLAPTRFSSRRRSRSTR
jgi:2-methylisocitrate lyase-like PEP mutase family enzyme